MFAVRSGATVEDALADVNGRQSRGVFFHQLAPEGQEAGDVVRMIVSQNHVVDVGQVDVQIARFIQHGFRVGARVDQNFVTVGYHQRRESPFAGTGCVANEHGGKNRDFQRLNLLRRCCGLVRWGLSRGWKRREQEQRDNEAGCGKTKRTNHVWGLEWRKQSTKSRLGRDSKKDYGASLYTTPV